MNVSSLVDRLPTAGVRALALTGSWARKEAGPYSDIDVLCFVDETHSVHAEGETFIQDEQLIVVSVVTPAQVEEWFNEPHVAVNTIMGVRAAQPLRDHLGYFARIQTRAEAFVWDAAMQERANRWASEQMVGWVEEVHKGLEGLRQTAFGIEGEDGYVPTLREQVTAGLRLYVETAGLLRPQLRTEDAPLIAHTCALVRTTLAMDAER